MRASDRILVNTVAQYLRTGSNVLLALVSTRWVLQALGANDYGIYNLIAGVVSMLTFFTNALTSTTQRYLSYHDNKKNIIIQKGYFLNSVAIHLGFGLLFSCVLISIGPFLFDGFLNIQSSSIPTAKVVFYLVIAMLFIALMTSPYRAVLVSHENIVYLSVIDVLDGILKLLIAYILFFFESGRLVWYAVFIGGISIVNLLTIAIYAYLKYPETRVGSLRLLDKEKAKELTSFAGWTIYGTLCLFGRIQGLAIVLNKFFSTVINAAYGISLQVNAALGSISGALQTAIAPQLIKAEGANNRAHMLRLSEIGCKLSFILLAMFSIPILFNMQDVLAIWLGNVPEYSSFFCKILIIANLCDQLTVGFNSTMNAVGNIRNFLVVVNTIKFSTCLIIALLLWIGVELQYAFATYVLIEILGCVLRIWFCKHNAGLDVVHYVQNVILRLIIPTGIICLSAWAISCITFNLLFFIIECIILIIIYATSVFLLGLSADEKIIVRNIWIRIWARIKKRLFPSSNEM